MADPRQRKTQRQIEYWLLGLLLLGVFAFYLTQAWQTAYIAPDTYFTLRQVEHIKETGVPLVEDSLGFGGRTLPVVPGSYYIVALLSFILPFVVVMKILPTLSAVAVGFLSFAIAKKLTSKKFLPLLASFFAVGIPGLFVTTNPELLIFIPFFLLALKQLLELTTQRNVVQFLFTTILLILISPLSIIFILILCFYLLLQKLESATIKPIEKESALFFSMFLFWFYMILFKKSILTNGFAVLRENVPAALIDQLYQQVTIVQSVIFIGLVPLVLGTIGAYVGLFQERKKPELLLSATILVLFAAIWIRALPLPTGLTLVGIGLAIMSVKAVSMLWDAVKASKLSKLAPLFMILIIIIGGIVTIGPAVYANQLLQENYPQSDEIEALLWLNENTDDQSLIAATVEEGELIEAIAHRKTLINAHFLGIPNADERYEDMKTIFTAKFQTDVTPILIKYGITHIYVSPRAQQQYNLTVLPYLGPPCLDQAYGFGKTEIHIYEVKCLDETR